MLQRLKLALQPLLIGAGCGAAVAGAVMAGQWLFNVYLGLRRFHGIGFVGPVISFIATALLVGIIQFRAQQQRNARLARAQVVADCNHEIRNALQTLVALNYPQESLDQIRAAVRRIDWALREVLPRLQEGDAARQKWEILNGRLQVRGQKRESPEVSKSARPH